MPGLLGTISGRVTLDIRQAVGAYATLRAQNAKTVYAMRGASESFIGAGKSMLYGGGLLVAAFGLAVKEAADFERKMDFFGAVTDTNKKKMQELSKFTLQLAQDTIFSAGEIADGFIELGKSGVTAQQIINGIGQAVANLGAAGDIPLAQSGQIITSTIQQYDLAAKDAVRVTDLLAGAANASIADISDIGTSLKYVGGVANAAGLSFEDTATAISLLAKAGIRGSTAGTSLRQMIVSLGGATGPAREALKELGILTEDGNNKFYDMQGRLKPLSSVFQILQDHLDGYNQKEKLAYLRTIFNNRALAAAALLTRDGAKGFKQMYKEMSKVSAADVAHERLDNLSGDIEILKGNIQTLLVQAGGPFQKTARQWVQSLTKLVQAFGELDPETQKNIVQFIGLAGAALVVMGALNLVLGIVFRFVASMIKMGAAMKLVGKLIRIAAANARWAAVLFGGELAAALGVTTGVLLIIIAAVVAFIAVWILAYKHIEPFRKAVNAWYGAIWKAITAFAKFIKLLATDPGAAWDKIVERAKYVWNVLQMVFSKAGPFIRQEMSRAAAAVGLAVGQMIGWFRSLPGRVMGVITTLMGWLRQTFTLSNVISALGTAVGTILAFFIKLPFKILNLMLIMVNGVIRIVGTLAPKVLGTLAYMVGFAIGLFIRLGLRCQSLVSQMVLGILRFMLKLPGRVIGLMSRMASGAISLVGRMAHALPGLASRAASGIITFLAKLPGRVANIFGRVVSSARRFLSRLPTIARQFANAAFQALTNGLEGLPGIVGGILGRVIEAFKGVIKAGYEAAKSVASGLWNGFKDGLGISSPSFIERAMWQITGTVEKETKRLAKHTMHVQRLSEQMAKTKFSPTFDTSGRRRLVDVAMMHERNRKRSQSLLTASQRGEGARRNAPSHGSPRQGDNIKIRGKLRLDGSDAYIEGIVEDMLGESDHQNAATARRRTGRG